MAICLVTGGAGFIGSHLVEALLRVGHTVRVLDNFSTGSRDNLAGVRDRIDIIPGDITDQETVHIAMREIELVFHQAALDSVPRGIADPLATNKACVDGTLHVLEAAREAKVRRVIYAASSSAYGNSERLPMAETDATNPLSPCAVAKLAGEHYCAAFAKVHGLETVRLRYFNVFGPRQRPDGPYAAVIPLFIQALTTGQSPVIHGDGEQSRDFTYVADAVQANLRAAEAPNAAGKVYNVACGQRTSLLELVQILNSLLGTDLEPRHGPARLGDVKHSQADIEQARTDLGYRPTTDMYTGLSHCLAWWQKWSEKAAKQTPRQPVAAR